MLEIDCVGERLILLPDKAIFWPAAGSLIVADLHLGKPAAFRAAGIGVPESTTAADLQRLAILIHRTKSRRVIVLGDLMHAPTGMHDVVISTVERWRADHGDIEIILVPGNHDVRCGLPPDSWKIQSTLPVWRCEPFTFSHRPIDMADSYVFAGHLHPAVVMRSTLGRGLRAPCFWFGARTVVLPAFGSFTGMSNIKPSPGERIFAIGPEDVIELPLRNRTFQKAFRRGAVK